MGERSAKENAALKPATRAISEVEREFAELKKPSVTAGPLPRYTPHQVGDCL